MPRIPKPPVPNCHIPISASEDIKLKVMEARLLEQLQGDFIASNNIKTIKELSKLNIKEILPFKSRSLTRILTIETLTATFLKFCSSLFFISFCFIIVTSTLKITL